MMDSTADPVVGIEDGVVMAVAARKSRLCVSLDRDTYEILVQKAAHARRSLSDYIRTLIAEDPPLVAEVSVHDLTTLTEELRHFLVAADVYRNDMKLWRGVSMRLSDRAMVLYFRVYEVLKAWYGGWIKSRETFMQEERARVAKLLAGTRNCDRRATGISVPAHPRYQVDVLVSEEELALLNAHAACIGDICGSQDEAGRHSHYLRTLIRAKRNIFLTPKRDDLDALLAILAKLTGMADALILTMNAQGEAFSENADSVDLFNARIIDFARAIWKGISNDRQAVYREFLGKVSYPATQEKDTGRRRRSQIPFEVAKRRVTESGPD